MSFFYKEILLPIISNIETNQIRNAFCINNKFYSYKLLGQYISKIRNAICSSSETNNIFGLVANDDIETYASIFALWLEGKSYIPLHPKQPIDRCLDIVEQVSISKILDSSSNTRYEKSLILKTNTLEYIADFLEYEDQFKDDDLAYILFTSGSTGNPKGVMLSRNNIASFMNSFWQTDIVITHDDRCLQCFDLTFDVSIQSFLVGLTKGACIYTVPHESIKYTYVFELLEKYKITFGAMAPSMLRYLQPYFNEIDATSLRICILTAEACPLSLLEEWYNCAINTDIYDFYGPTEATIYCTYYKLTRGGYNKSLNGIVSIGKPLSNVTAIIVDNGLNVLPPGEKGELCIAGEQVATGYWKNFKKNSDSFFEKMIDGKRFRFYHTGDFCYRDQDGDFMYYGRIDNQVKIQGYRIELGEIEYFAREFLANINVVALPFINNYKITEICLFIEADAFDISRLKEFLSSKLPPYMIPTKILFERKFPLNTSDKIDKISLANRI